MSKKKPYDLKKPYKSLEDIEAEIKSQQAQASASVKPASNSKSIFDDSWFNYQKNYSISLNNRNEIESGLTQLYLKKSSSSQIDTSNVSKYEAVYDYKTASYSMVLTDVNGKQKKLVGVALDHEDVIRLSGKLSKEDRERIENGMPLSNTSKEKVLKSLNRDKVSKVTEFKQALYGKNKLYKRIYDSFNFGFGKGGKSKLNKIFKNNRLVQGMRTARLGVRNTIRSTFRSLVTNPAKRVAHSLTTALKPLMSQIGALILKLLLNPYIGIPLLIIVVFFLVITSLPSPVYLPSEPHTARVVDNPLLENISKRYNRWSEVGLDLAAEYGIYFNLVDSFTLASFNNPSLLFMDDEEIKEKYPNWDFDYFAKNTFLSMLGPMETRTEYYHWVWGDWVKGFTVRPTQFTQTRSYTVKERTWNPAVTTTRTFCSLKNMSHVRWEISSKGSCPSFADESTTQSTTPGFWTEKDVRYYDGRNILESWWSTKNENVARRTDGMVNLNKYTYTEPPLPTVEKPVCKNCNSALVIKDDYITKTVSYWTVKSWETIVKEYFNLYPDGSRFKSFFNIREAAELDYGVIRQSFNKFSDSQKFLSHDKDRSIDYVNLFFEHYRFSAYPFLVEGKDPITLTEYSEGLDQIRITFNEAYGDDLILHGLVFSFTDPTNYVGKLTSGYGMRFIGGRWSFHYAIDLAAPMGTPLIGVRDGGVVVSTYNQCPSRGSGFGDPCGPANFRGSGNNVIIKYPFMTQEGERYDIFVEYAHLQKDSILVRVGDIVNRDQVIAKMGSSGSSTGSHVHFVVWAVDTNGNKSYMNPAYLIKRRAN